MASDFLIEELDRISAEYPGEKRAAIIDDYAPVSRLKGGYAAAYGFSDDEEEYTGKSSQELQAAEEQALWGGGIPMSNDDDENPRGMDVVRGF
jgi:hypothetical protein